jgi:methylglutaconyl-CoA hydratase
MDEPVISTRDGRVATLTLNRPARRNVLNQELVVALKRRLDEVEADEGVRVVVLTGAGTTFCAGADLGELRRLREASFEDNLADSKALADLFRRIYLFPKPVVAKVNGHALGGGCGLALVCDIAIASQSARLGFPEVRLGFVPAIVSVFVLRKLGEAAARDLLLRGPVLDAEDARAVGLVSRVSPPDRLDDDVARLVLELAHETSAQAVAHTRQLIGDLGGALDEQLDRATRANAEARRSEDFGAGLEAFFSRHPPPWKGR